MKSKYYRAGVYHSFFHQHLKKIEEILVEDPSGQQTKNEVADKLLGSMTLALEEISMEEYCQEIIESQDANVESNR